MRFVQKKLSILCAAAMMTALLAACGGSQTERPAGGAASEKPNPEATGDKQQFENKELNIAVFEGGYGKAYWEEVVRRFEADYPGVKVNMTANPKIMDIIKPQLVAGNPPDFVYSNGADAGGVFQALINEKGFLDITDVFEGKALGEDVPLKDKLMDGILDHAKPLGDGKIYFGPANLGVQGLWYNKNYFDGKGWKAPETWDEFFALGDVAKKDGRALFTYQGIYPSYNISVLMPMIASAGGLNAIQNYDENAWKSDAVRKTFEIFEKIAQNDYLLKGTVALNHTQSQTEFLKGNALFIPNGTWFEGEMKDAPREDGFEYGFMAPPVFKKGDQRYAYGNVEYFFIPKKAKNPQLAKEFIRYQYKTDMVKLNAEKSSGIMPVKNAVEVVKEYIPVSAYNAFKVFDTGTQLLMPKFKLAEGVKVEVNMAEEIYNPLSSIMNKKITVDEWMERVEKASTKYREAYAKAGK
ncbi:carbohydrate ABC transporter substrate-binding protein [Paenibacillus contaminans]|uniref:Carbohydrate ABC transporter substrate-binding protein n=1 Tax=Paenibacillus contaminans TaxID=450362 RepID=A0A329MNZ8_9BACL|nr:carbohydrate ABC transporter substrate-binding protein [Paenibacillus contaminans]RAV21046.1 carbohydrate ABC transporter substrate-binding protein [Paenibacillus contaminans]